MSVFGIYTWYIYLYVFSVVVVWSVKYFIFLCCRRSACLLGSSGGGAVPVGGVFGDVDCSLRTSGSSRYCVFTCVPWHVFSMYLGWLFSCFCLGLFVRTGYYLSCPVFFVFFFPFSACVFRCCFVARMGRTRCLVCKFFVDLLETQRE